MAAVIIGAGISGLSAAVTMAAMGCEVDLVSLCPASRSDSSIQTSGIATLGSLSKDEHLEDLLQMSAGLSQSKNIKILSESVSQILALCQNLGVPFDLRPDGRIKVYPSQGRAGQMAAGYRTSAVLLKLLDGQVRVFEKNKLIRRHESSELLSLVRDDQGDLAGVVIVDRESMELRTLAASTLLLSVGGVRDLFESAPTSTVALGSSLGMIFKEGAILANAEFIQWQPYCIKKSGATFDVGSALLARGARPVLVRKQKRWYFLEDLYPENWMTLSPAQTFKAIHEAQVHMDEGDLYLDATQIKGWDEELDGLKASLTRWTGLNVINDFIQVQPGDPYLVGGIATDESCRSMIRGVFAAGECQASHLGAQMPASYRLLSSLGSGLTAGSKMIEYLSLLDHKPSLQSLFDQAIQLQHQEIKKLRHQKGKENSYQIHEDLVSVTSQSLNFARHNHKLAHTDRVISELKNRIHEVSLKDTGFAFNEDLLFLKRLPHMLEAAHVMVRSALYRNESRGMHFKPEFSTQDDDRYLKNTRARYEMNGPQIEYEDLSIRKRLTIA